MLRYLVCASAIALAVPAVGQSIQQQPPISDPAMEAPVENAKPADSENSPYAPVDDTAAVEPQPANDPAQVASVVEQEFPKADADSSGDLDQREFAAWMIPLQAAQMPEGDTADQTELAAMAGTAFAQADTDSSQAVSKEELTAFLLA